MNEADEQQTALEEFMGRFYALQQEAKAAGLATVCVLMEDDPLADTETVRLQHAGCGPAMLLGMLAHARITAVYNYGPGRMEE